MKSDIKEMFKLKNLFLTGDISVGKTTLLKNALKRIDNSIGGFMTVQIDHAPFKTFISKSLYDKDIKIPLAKVDTRDLSKEIYIESFSKDLISVLDKSYEKCDLIVLDELGFLENDIDIFTNKIYELLDSEKPIFGVLKDYDCEFLNNIRNRDETIIIRVTEENRDFILNDILKALDSFGLNINNEQEKI